MGNEHKKSLDIDLESLDVKFPSRPTSRHSGRSHHYHKTNPLELDTLKEPESGPGLDSDRPSELEMSRAHYAKPKLLNAKYGIRLALGAAIVGLAVTVASQFNDGASKYPRNGTIDTKARASAAVSPRYIYPNSNQAPQASPSQHTEQSGSAKYVPTIHKVKPGDNPSLLVYQYYFGNRSYNAVVQAYLAENNLKSARAVARQDTPVVIKTYRGNAVEQRKTEVREGEEYIAPLNRAIHRYLQDDIALNRIQNQPNLIIPNDNYAIADHFSPEEKKPETHAKFRDLEGISQDGSNFALTNSTQYGAEKNSQSPSARREFNLALARELMDQYVKEEEVRHSARIDYAQGSTPQNSAANSLANGRNFRLALARELIEQDVQEERMKHHGSDCGRKKLYKHL